MAQPGRIAARASILVLRGNKESASAVNECEFRARSPLEQQLDHVHVPVLRRHKQRRGPVSLHLQTWYSIAKIRKINKGVKGGGEAFSNTPIAFPYV